MKRFLLFGTLVLILVVLLLSGISDARASVTDTTIPDSEVANNASKTDKSDSVSATITITWTTAGLPGECADQ